MIPDLTAGHCLTGAAGLPADAWLSGFPEKRAEAMAACRTCPVLAECRAWALSLPGEVFKHAIIGGMGLAEYRRRRREAAA